MVEFESSSKQLAETRSSGEAESSATTMLDELRNSPARTDLAAQAFPSSEKPLLSLAANKNAQDRPEKGIEPIPPWKPDPICRWPFDPWCPPDNPPMPWDPKPKPKQTPKPKK